tara:strand:+ start:966 stop:1127 length:162 start_codon:yes stop_codon:yes gene_type:complete
VRGNRDYRVFPLIFVKNEQLDEKKLSHWGFFSFAKIYTQNEKITTSVINITTT